MTSTDTDIPSTDARGASADAGTTGVGARIAGSGSHGAVATDGGGSPSLPGEHWWRALPAWVLPVLIAAIQVGGCALAELPLGTGLPVVAGPWLPELLGFALLILGSVALLGRHRRPLLTLTVALAATDAYLILGYPRGPYFLAAVAALVAAASRARRGAVWSLAILSFLPVLVALWFTGIFSGGYHRSILYINDIQVPGTSYADTALVFAWLASGLAIGEVIRAQRERRAASDRARAEAERARAEAERAQAEADRAQAEADRAREEQTRRLASDERLRIAQELHDVIGHHLSLINVRAGVALHLFDRQPGQAREALEAIKLASAEALREVRGLLATLTPRPAPRAPTPDLAALEALVTEAEAAGTPVHIVRTGTPRPLPGEVERAAYRIVREALTNVRRHAGPGALVTVTVDYAVDGLTVRVTDTGSGPSTPDGQEPDGPEATGSGITGMRERAAALGGWLNAGPGPDGVGFVVEAFLPAPRDDRAEAGEAP
jgi:signal transduction histidine kinase